MQRDVRIAATSGLRRPAAAVSRTPPCSTRTTTRYEALNGISSRRSGTARDIAEAADRSRGAAASPTRRRTSASPAGSTSTRRSDFAVSLTKVKGRAHVQGAASTTPTATRREQTSNNAFGTINFQQTRSAPIRSTRRSASPTRRSARSARSRRREVRRDALRLQQHRGLRPGQLEGDRRLTLDYGVRFVHQQPQYDKLGQASNFLPEKWTRRAGAGAVRAGLHDHRASVPVPGREPAGDEPADRSVPRARTRRWHRRHARAEHRQHANGLFLPGQRHRRRRPTRCPALALAPRFGMAYDVTGKQKFVLRGGVGLFFDRPSGNDVLGRRQQSADVRNVTVRYAPAADARQRRPDDQGAPSLARFSTTSKLPVVVQWNGGMQMALPWAIVARRRRTSGSTATTRSRA